MQVTGDIIGPKMAAVYPTPGARIHTIGDAVGQSMLAHKTLHEGHVTAEVIANGRGKGFTKLLFDAGTHRLGGGGRGGQLDRPAIGQTRLKHRELSEFFTAHSAARPTYERKTLNMCVFLKKTIKAYFLLDYGEERHVEHHLCL